MCILNLYIFGLPCIHVTYIVHFIGSFPFELLMMFCNFYEGTIVLWVCWPSFNAVLVEGVPRNRAIVNTYYAIITSCVTACAFSSLITKSSKLSMVGIYRLLASQIIFGVEA